MRNANERHSETTEELEEEQDLRVVSKYLPTAFLPPTETPLLKATVHVILRGNVADAPRAKRSQWESHAS